MKMSINSSSTSRTRSVKKPVILVEKFTQRNDIKNRTEHNYDEIKLD